MQTDRNPFAPALWLAIVLAGLSAILAVARCGPAVPYVRPLVALCPVGCDAGHRLCLDAAARVSDPSAQASAVIGCRAGRDVCHVWCERAGDELETASEPQGAAKAALASGPSDGPCRAFWEGCITQGDPDVCHSGVTVCLARMRE